MRLSPTALPGVQSPRTGRWRRTTASWGDGMKTFALAVALAAVPGLTTRADGRTALSGKYTVGGGKKTGADIDEKAKKAPYTVTADTFTIAGGDQKFVISYKLKPGAKPVEIDMSIAEG